MSLISLIISAILQVAIVLLICFVVFKISQRKITSDSKTTFRRYIGLVRPNSKAVYLAIGVSIATGICAVGVKLSGVVERFAEYQSFVGSGSSPVSSISGDGLSLYAIAYSAIYAIIQTGLSEEILFRGLIAKRLIAIFGYTTGNLLQAFAFALMHIGFLMAVRTESSFALFSLFFTIPFLGAYLMGYLNERKGNGSIVPSWIIHVSANFVVAVASAP